MTLVVQQFVSPAVAAAGLPHQPTGNMEGKEVRFGDTSKGELLAVHVASESDVAATKGSDAAMAAEHRITQIVLGATRRSRWAEWRGGSVVRAVLREAAEAGIDVHVIARRDVGPEG